MTDGHFVPSDTSVSKCCRHKAGYAGYYNGQKLIWMRSWLHDAASKPYIKKKFSQLKLDDRLLELTYSLNNPSDQESDDDFVINIFAQYMVIGWLKPQVDNAINTAMKTL